MESRRTMDTSVDQPRTPRGIIHPAAGPRCATSRARSSSPTNKTPGRAREGLAMKTPEATRNAALHARTHAALSPLLSDSGVSDYENRPDARNLAEDLDA